MLSPFIGAGTSPFPDSRGGNIDAISTWSRAGHILKKVRDGRNMGGGRRGRFTVVFIENNTITKTIQE